ALDLELLDLTLNQGNPAVVALGRLELGALDEALRGAEELALRAVESGEVPERDGSLAAVVALGGDGVGALEGGARVGRVALVARHEPELVQGARERRLLARRLERLDRVLERLARLGVLAELGEDGAERRARRRGGRRPVLEAAEGLGVELARLLEV